ncbi:MAG: alpha-E domain-containing protein [Phycisphaerae bacterium]|nr:alpha-E domain-containing protein [Phycisphaerae bacterium]
MSHSASDPPLSRPMSSDRQSLPARVADASYWMSRYVERSEHLARVLLVSADMLTGTGDLDETLADQLCRDVLAIAQQSDRYDPWRAECGSSTDFIHTISRHLVLDLANPNSVLNCISRARENARTIRESISAEMWEHLNTLYWSFQSDVAGPRFADAPQERYRQVMTGSLLFQGVTDQTLDHGQVWLFMQLSKYLERVDMTCRILAAKFSTLDSLGTGVEGPLQVLQWMAVLRSCCSIESFRRLRPYEMDAVAVATFVIFEPSFPRSVLFCIRHALQSVDRIRAMLSADAGREAQRLLGRLLGELQYPQGLPNQPDELRAFLDRTRLAAATAAVAVQDQWFMRALDSTAVVRPVVHGHLKGSPADAD